MDLNEASRSQSKRLIEALERHATGHVGAAVEILKDGLRSENASPEELRTLARLALDVGDAPLAIQAAGQLLEKQPDDANGLSSFARAARQLSSPESEPARRRLEHKARTSSEAAFGRALLALDVRAGSEAIPWLDLAVFLAPEHVPARSLRAGCLVRAKRFSEARADYDKVLDHDPKQVRALLGRARLNGMTGDFTAAEADYRAILTLVPGYAPALSGLLGLNLADAEQLRRQSERALSGDRLLDGHRVEVLYALAKSYANENRPKRAWTAARRANRYQASNGQFDETGLRVQLALDRTFISHTPKERDGPIDPCPVLVCGMPRSGTTLVESILARHADVEAAGEVPFFRNAARWLGAQPEPAKALLSRRVELRRGYLARLRAISPDASLVVDKMPENWRFLGLAHALLSSIPVVWVQRDPRDVAVSIYLEHFAPAESFAHDLGSITAMIKAQQDTLRFWLNDSSHRIVVVRYETLLHDPDAEIPRLLRELGLAFDKNCLRPEEDDRPIDTPSRWQVRQRLNTRSIGRWRNYEQFAPDRFKLLTDLAMQK